MVKNKKFRRYAMTTNNTIYKNYNEEAMLMMFGLATGDQELVSHLNKEKEDEKRRKAAVEAARELVKAESKKEPSKKEPVPVAKVEQKAKDTAQKTKNPIPGTAAYIEQKLSQNASQKAKSPVPGTAAYIEQKLNEQKPKKAEVAAKDVSKALDNKDDKKAKKVEKSSDDQLKLVREAITKGEGPLDPDPSKNLQEKIKELTSFVTFREHAKLSSIEFIELYRHLNSKVVKNYINNQFGIKNFMLVEVHPDDAPSFKKKGEYNFFFRVIRSNVYIAVNSIPHKTNNGWKSSRYIYEK